MKLKPEAAEVVLSDDRQSGIWYAKKALVLIVSLIFSALVGIRLFWLLLDVIYNETLQKILCSIVILPICIWFVGIMFIRFAYFKRINRSFVFDRVSQAAVEVRHVPKWGFYYLTPKKFYDELQSTAGEINSLKTYLQKNHITYIQFKSITVKTKSVHRQKLVPSVLIRWSARISQLRNIYCWEQLLTKRKMVKLGDRYQSVKFTLLEFDEYVSQELSKQSPHKKAM